MALYSVFTILVGVLLLVASAESREVHKTSEDKVEAISPALRRYMTVSAANPLAIKSARLENSGLRGAEVPIHSESAEKMYVSFQYFSDSACTQLMLSTSQQLDKCFMDGGQASNGVRTPTYYYNTLIASGDMYTISSSAYDGHCMSNGALKTPLYTDTESFPMMCTALGSMWGMTVISATTPTYPSAEGTVFK
jgi:hypothetical protein